jgi:hypothetical protein
MEKVRGRVRERKRHRQRRGESATKERSTFGDRQEVRVRRV